MIGYCIVPACVELSMVRLSGEAAESTFTDSEETQTYRKRHRLLESVCLLCVYYKGVMVCMLGAVEQNPLSTVLTNQAGVLLHLCLVAGAFALAGVGCIGHDGPSV